MLSPVEQKNYDKILSHFYNIWANLALFFVYFRPFLIQNSIIPIEKSVDGVLGVRTRGRMIVGVDETTELWRPRNFALFNLWAELYILTMELFR